MYAGAVAAQKIGSLGLHAAQLGEVARGQLVDALQRRMPAVQAGRLEGIEGLVGPESTRQVHVAEDVAVVAGYREERTPRSQRLDGHDRRGRAGPGLGDLQERDDLRLALGELVAQLR